MRGPFSDLTMLSLYDNIYKGVTHGKKARYPGSRERARRDIERSRKEARHLPLKYVRNRLRGKGRIPASLAEDKPHS